MAKKRNESYPFDIVLNLMNLIFIHVDRELSRFPQFGTHFVLDVKHWHHASDLF